MVRKLLISVNQHDVGRSGEVRESLISTSRTLRYRALFIRINHSFCMALVRPRHGAGWPQGLTQGGFAAP
jgi:hypothetical protein